VYVCVCVCVCVYVCCVSGLASDLAATQSANSKDFETKRKRKSSSVVEKVK
jgi:hypothetical protein